MSLLAVAVCAASSAAPLIREAAAPAFAVAFWRNLLASGLLVPFAAVRRRRELVRLTPRERRLTAAAGLLLAAHFGTWVSSLSFTSVASSVALVSTQPVWAAVIARARGADVPPRVWAGMAVSLAGVLALSGVDVTVSTRALFGDALALVGAFLVAAYLTAGSEVRQTVSTATYTAVCYSVAAVALLLVCVSAGQPLAGYPLRVWLCLAGLTVGPQLLGHSVVNRVLRTTNPTVVSVSLLFQILGSALLAALLFGETPPAAAVPAAALIAGGVVVVVRSAERSATSAALD